MTLSRKERLEQARAQVGEQKVMLETFENGRRDLSADALRDHHPEEPMMQASHPSLRASLPEVPAMSVVSIALILSPAPVPSPSLSGSLPVLTADGAVVPSMGQRLVTNPVPLANPFAASSLPAMVSVVDQMRSAAKSFDRWRVTRHHIGVRVMQQSKARLRRITKRLGVRSMGAALDYLLADAEQRLFGIVQEDG